MEVLHQRGHGGHQADLGQGLPHAAAGALREGEVPLGPLAVLCTDTLGGHNVCAQAHQKLPETSSGPLGLLNALAARLRYVRAPSEGSPSAWQSK